MSEPQTPKAERVAKILARAGLCSRRDAERWIAEGRVSLNGKVLTSPAVNIANPAALTVDGKPLPETERARLWRYHKPAGLVTTHRDEKGRDTVFDKLPEGTPRLISVGRLDLNSEGLLLLTNDGELARKLELPANGWIRRYKVRVHGIVDAAQLAVLEKGVTVEGVAYGPIHASFEGEQRASNIWLTVALREGRNREVRKVMAHLGLAVTRLIRVSYGPFQLGLLARGALEEVPPRVLREQLGEAGDTLEKVDKREQRQRNEKRARGAIGARPALSDKEAQRERREKREQRAKLGGSRPSAKPAYSEKRVSGERFEKRERSPERTGGAPRVNPEHRKKRASSERSEKRERAPERSRSAPRAKPEAPEKPASGERRARHRW